MKRRFGLKLGDIFLMGGILLLALVLFLLPFLKEQGTQAEIYIASTDQRQVISLEEDGLYPIFAGEMSLLLQVSQGAAFMVESPCPDRVCVNSPAISRPGQSIVCLPAGVVVRVLGEEAAVDGVSG